MLRKHIFIKNNKKTKFIKQYGQKYRFPGNIVIYIDSAINSRSQIKTIIKGGLILHCFNLLALNFIFYGHVALFLD